MTQQLHILPSTIFVHWLMNELLIPTSQLLLLSFLLFLHHRLPAIVGPRRRRWMTTMTTILAPGSIGDVRLFLSVSENPPSISIGRLVDILRIFMILQQKRVCTGMTRDVLLLMLLLLLHLLLLLRVMIHVSPIKIHRRHGGLHRLPTRHPKDKTLL